MNDIIARIVVGGVEAAIAYALFPGSQVFEKGLASLTLGDIAGIFISGLFALAAVKVFSGETA